MSDEIYLRRYLADVSELDPFDPTKELIPGPSGPKGDKGDKGDPGNDGIDGQDGIDGAQGPQGIQGPIGPQGIQGEQGIPGVDGIDGESAFSLDIPIFVNGFWLANAGMGEGNPNPPIAEYTNFLAIGDRRQYIRVTLFVGTGSIGGNLTTLINGNTAETNVFWTGDSLNSWLNFDFGHDEYVITEVKWYQSIIGSHGNWKWQASHDNLNWVDVSSSFNLGTATVQIIPLVNTLRYRYYRIIGLSGSRNNSIYIGELEFKISKESWAPSATSYSNPCGMGDRTALITVTSTQASLTGTNGQKLVNGSYANEIFWGGDITNIYIRFDFNSPKIIDEARLIQSSAVAHGTWQWQVSSDNITWINIGGTQVLGDKDANGIIIGLGGNKIAYRYYQLLGVVGSVSPDPYLREIEFKVGA